jgi:hypothetical protein
MNSRGLHRGESLTQSAERGISISGLTRSVELADFFEARSLINREIAERVEERIQAPPVQNTIPCEPRLCVGPGGDLAVARDRGRRRQLAGEHLQTRPKQLGFCGDSGGFEIVHDTAQPR